MTFILSLQLARRASLLSEHLGTKLPPLSRKAGRLAVHARLHIRPASFNLSVKGFSCISPPFSPFTRLFLQFPAFTPSNQAQT